VPASTAVPVPTPSQLVPDQIKIVVEQHSNGTVWWAIPLATLIAALVAGGFLTWNEALKRRREDRRQWEREIRDMCVTATQAASGLIMLLRKAEYSPEEKAEAQRAADVINDINGKIDLIGKPLTARAAVSLMVAARDGASAIQRDAEDRRTPRRDLIRAIERITAIVKHDNKIDSTRLEHDRYLRSKSIVYVRLPRFLKRKFYGRFVKKYGLLD
jgi:hypothetical protein